MVDTKFQCRWGTTCQKTFNDVEDLYFHLTNEHIGRKSTNNLCLTCQWNNCGTGAAKRDHLASHLRVHLPLKRKNIINCFMYLLLNCSFFLI
jgi:hypothetical protein